MLFTFPSRYCSSIGHQVVFWLGGWSPRLPTGFLVSRGTLDPASFTSISTTWLSHSLTGLPRPFVYRCFLILPSATPTILLQPVWPLPISLATTFGISVDYFSSPYLDVSVQAVPHAHLFDSVCVTTGLLWWVSPFGHPRIVAYLQLPEAFRSLSRPSSAPDAKAFPLRSYSLDLLLHKPPLVRLKLLSFRLVLFALFGFVQQCLQALL